MSEHHYRTTQYACLTLTIVLSSVAWSFAIISFHDLKMALLWVGIGLLTLLQLAQPGRLINAFSVWMPAWVGLVVLGATGLFFAQVPSLSANAALRSGGLLFFATLLYPIAQSEAGRLVILRALFSATIISALLALGQWGGFLNTLFPAFEKYDQRMYSVMGNEGLLGGYVALGLILLPESLGVFQPKDSWVRWLAAGILGLLLLTVLLLSASRGAQVAFLIGVLVYGFVPLGGLRPRRAALVGGLVLAFLIGLGVVGGSVGKWDGTFSIGDTGGRVRLWIWDGAVAMLRDHPAGVGLGNFSYWVPRYMGASPYALENSATTYHAHFDFLELLCESGIFGPMILLWLGSRFSPRNTTALAGLVLLATFSCTFPVWSSLPHALAALLLLGLNLRGHGTAGEENAPEPRGRRLGIVLLPIVISCGLLHSAVALWPSYLLRRAEDIHLAGGEAASAYESALSGLGYRGEAHLNYAVYLIDQGTFQAARTHLMAAEMEVDTGRLHYLIYRAASELQSHVAAMDALDAAQLRWPWLKPGAAAPGVALSDTE